MAEVAALKDALATGEDEQKRGRSRRCTTALSVIPNLPREDVPEGKDEHGNVELRKVGTPPKLAVSTSRCSTSRSASGSA